MYLRFYQGKSLSLSLSGVGSREGDTVLLVVVGGRDGLRGHLGAKWMRPFINIQRYTWTIQEIILPRELHVDGWVREPLDALSPGCFPTQLASHLSHLPSHHPSWHQATLTIRKTPSCATQQNYFSNAWKSASDLALLRN